MPFSTEPPSGDVVPESAASGRAGRERNAPIFFLLMALGFVLESSYLFPNLDDLNLWDECYYLDQGRLLVENGSLPLFAQAPLLALFYAAIYLVFRSSDFWMVHAATCGHIAIFALTWISLYLIARELRKLASPWIVLGFLLITPVPHLLVENSSDGFFATTTAFAFWSFLVFVNHGRHGNLRNASLLIGLAALIRVDGVVLFAIFVPLALALRPKSIGLARTAAYSLAPFLLVTGAYVAIYFFQSGELTLGIQRRSYAAFEQGHEEVAKQKFGRRDLDDRAEVEAIFGTAEENSQSVVRAILRHPGAFFQRLCDMSLYLVPEKAAGAYGRSTALVVAALCVLGLVTLWKTADQRRLLALIVLWPCFLLVYFLTFFRYGYFLLPFYAVLTLAAIGAAATIRTIAERRSGEAWFLLTCLAGMALTGLATKRAFLFLTGAAVFIGLAIVILLLRKREVAGRGLPALLIIGACVLMAQRGFFEEPGFRRLGEGPAEQAMLLMKRSLEPGARVGAYFPGIVWAAQREFVYLGAYDRGRDDLASWIEKADLSALCLSFRAENRQISELEDLLAAHQVSGRREEFTGPKGTAVVILLDRAR